MTAPPRLIVAGAAALALVAGCNRDTDKAKTAPPADVPAKVTPADAAAPFGYDSQSTFANVKLTLPQTLKPHPDLHVRLYSTSVRELRQFSEGAQADRTEFGGDGNQPAYEKTIVWVPTAETTRLLSLRRDASEFSGGPHPNATFGSALWDKTLQRGVDPEQLFRPDADLASLDRALCAAINAEKLKRDPQATRVTQTESGGFACPKAATTPFVMTPSAVPGKASGLMFLIGPYQVGAYAEGSYEVTLPAGTFQALLAPIYAAEFAGEGVPAGLVP